jgi:hypothetical protein
MTYIFHRLSVEIESEYIYIYIYIYIYVCVCVCEWVCVCVCVWVSEWERDMVQYLNFVYALFFFLPVRFSEAVYSKSISNQGIVFH